MTDLEIYYNNKKIENNEVFTPHQTSNHPEVKYNFSPNKSYILMMYDPDTAKGTRLHWLVVNIKGDNISNGKIILQYEGAAPPAGSGEHRYIFELYEQSNLPNINNMKEEERFISIDAFKKALNVSEYVSKIQFKSQNETGGKKTKKLKTNKKRKNKKPKKSRKRKSLHNI
jgi:phosphatidylethanolamine-binding protein (PEBP) family uncharacterized protein